MRICLRLNSVAIWLPGLVLALGMAIALSIIAFEPGMALWASMGVATLLTAGIAYQAIARPVVALAVAAENLTQGKHGIELPCPHGHELTLLAGAIEAMHTRIATDDIAFRENEARHRTVLEMAPYAIITTDVAGKMLAFNRAAEDMFGYSAPEALGHSISMLMPEKYRGSHERHVTESRSLRNPIVIGRDREVEGLRKDGGAFPIEINLSDIQLDGRRHYTAVIKDVSARKQAELANKRQRDLYIALSGINQMIVRKQDPPQIFQGACDILIRHEGFLRVCIKRADPRSENLVRVAATGKGWPEVEASDPIAIETPDSPLTSTYLQGRSMVLNDLASLNPKPEWVDAALRAGVHGCASFPVCRGGKPYAVLETYANTPGFFNSDIVQLLEEITIDLSFAQDNCDREADLQKGHHSQQLINALLAAPIHTKPLHELLQEALDLVLLANCLPLLPQGAIFLADPATRQLVLAAQRDWSAHCDRVSYGACPCGAAAENRIIQYMCNIDSQCEISKPEFQKFGQIGVPLLMEGRLLGVLNLYVNEDHELQEGEIACLEMLGRTLASVIDRKRIIADLRLAAQAFETQEGILITDRRGTILRANQAFSRITGYSPEELIGKNPRMLKSGRQGAEFYRRFWETLTTEGHWQGEMWNKRKNGEIYPEWLSITAVQDETGESTHYVATVADISKQKHAEARIERLAYYDELTQLPNRRLLMNRVEQSHALAARSGFIGALLFIDLDHFKHINDALGHAVGDMLLKEVAARLTMHLRLEDTVARLGGDEFIVVLANLGQTSAIAATQARVVAEKIRGTLNDPYELLGHTLHVSPSIGISLFPEGRSDADDLLKQADTAMYRSKSDGRDCVRFYEPGMQAAAEARLTIERDLRAALSGSDLFPLYQPQVDASGRIVGAEALLRWRRQGKGFIPPQEFIPIAEDTGLIVPIGERMLAEACRHGRDLASAFGNGSTQIAVNVSARQFHHPEFVERVTAIVKQADADPSFLTFELTEGMVLRDIADTIRKMESLKVLGVRFSLDDFGTGYSSLAYLKRLPLDEIKIDRSFIMDIPFDHNDVALVETILSVARHLKLSVVAEGVETAKQWRFLKERGCEFFQGFHFSLPVAFEDYAELLRRGAITSANRLEPTHAPFLQTRAASIDARENRS